MNAWVDIQQACEDPCPAVDQLRHWATTALQGQSAGVTVRIVSTDEMASLNERYRSKPGPTNVLSFPFEPPAGVPIDYLGDVVICAPVVELEARLQGKPTLAHWAHMVIHGVLHLRGYDHLLADQAEAMESLEATLLEQLGFNNPYEVEDLTDHE